MADEVIRLGPEDPTIFAKCPKCCKTGLGSKVGSIFMRAYTRRRWLRKPKCENCRTPMVSVFEIKEEKREAKREAARGHTARNRVGPVRSGGVRRDRQLLGPRNPRLERAAGPR